MYKQPSTLLAALIVIIALPVLARTLPSVPSTISYQGRITDVDFTVPDGDYEMTFLIYGNSIGGNLLWQETHPGVAVAGGLYKVELGGEDTPIEFAAFGGKDAWLEVLIFGEALGPRRRIVSAPFALRAEGEVPPGGIILGQYSGDTNITDLGYTQEGTTIKAFYLYKKKSYALSPPRVPTRIAYQGRVEPVAGGPLGSTADLTFTIYDADTLGNVKWTEAHPATPLNNGLFSVELGESTAITPDLLSPKDLWLAVSVNTQPLLPREKLSSSAYALKIQSPVPPGGIVLSGASVNPDLAAKKFTPLGGATVKGRYPFTKNNFSVAAPSVPLLINYQGRLTDTAGALLSADTIDMRFAIYDDQSAGSLLYSETIQDVPLSSGVFDVLLGSGDTLTPNTFPGPDAWLGITLTKGVLVDTLPIRQRLTSVPFALTAEGAMPPTALILAGTTNDSNLLNAGFQYTGDTVKSYYVFGKMEVDTTPPTLTIVAPTPLQGFSVSPVPVTVTYSDALSGVNPASFVALLNGVTVSGSFTLSGHTATGPLVPADGYNVLSVAVTDLAGNVSETSSAFYSEAAGDANPPQILLISPAQHATITTNTPLIQLQISDPQTGIWIYSVQINGNDRSSYFNLDGQTASWQVPGQLFLPQGANNISVEATNHSNMTASLNFGFTVNSTGPGPTITSLSPLMGFAGDTVIITGTGFSTVPAENSVYFYSNQFATVAAATSTQLTVTVPNGAISGPVHAVVNQRATNNKDFVTGLKYGFVANNDSGWVSGSPATGTVAAIDFDPASPGDTVNYIPCGSKPFDVAVSPDGKFAYASDNTGNKVCIINAAKAADSDTVQTISITGPRYLSVSPDGLEVFVGSESGALYTIKNHALVTALTKNLGNQINDLEISPLHQLLYVVRNKGNSIRGQVNYVSIDQGGPGYLQSKFIRDTYLKPVGVAITPDQTKIVVANNRSNASSYSGPQGQSFSILDAINGSQSLSQGAQIIPDADTHDVNWPFDVVFDPLGRLFFACFAEGFPSSTSVLGTSNNVGVQLLPSWTDDQFQAATQTKRDDPNRSPKGLAVSPGGGFIFSADFGSYTGEGDKIMVLDYQKVRTAIERDPSDNSYNLTGTAPENLESPSVYGNPNIVRTVTGFDGPRNIAFQEFPIVYLYPPVVHLALGGVKEGENQFHWRVHPIYGDSVMVGVDGTTTPQKIIFPGAPASLDRHWLSRDRYIYSINSGPVQNTDTLNPSLAGIAKVYMSSRGYPSNEIFVTVPPQKFIQVLFAEGCPSSNETVYRALASVVKNRIRLTRKCFNNSPIPAQEGCRYFDFPPVYWETITVPGNPPTVKHVRRMGGAEQVLASNASEKIAATQLSLAFNSGYPSVGTQRYSQAAQRDTVPDPQKSKYDMAVTIAGDALIDLMRTSSNDDEMSMLPQPDSNNSDLVQDPTGGSFSFYSPTAEQWGDSTIASSIAGTLKSRSTVFPSAGQFESYWICGNMLPSFCTGSPKQATYVQVVVANNIPANDCDPPRFGAPQFIFFRFRQANDPAVVWGP